MPFRAVFSIAGMGGGGEVRAADQAGVFDVGLEGNVELGGGEECWQGIEHDVERLMGKCPSQNTFPNQVNLLVFRVACHVVLTT